MNNDDATLEKKEKIESDEKINKQSGEGGMNWETSQVRNSKFIFIFYIFQNKIFLSFLQNYKNI